MRLQVTPWIPGVIDVRALRERVDRDIVQVTPLRLPSHLARAKRALNPVGQMRNVRWSRPPPLDGSPPHIVDNLGQRTRSDWTPAPTAPDPGPRRSWMVGGT